MVYAVPLVTVKKTPSKMDPNTWTEEVFYRIVSTKELIDWCVNTLGSSTYMGKWFDTGLGYVVMKEEVYLLWQLSR